MERDASKTEIFQHEFIEGKSCVCVFKNDEQNKRIFLERPTKNRRKYAFSKIMNRISAFFCLNENEHLIIENVVYATRENKK
jgi:hypothetical protein